MSGSSEHAGGRTASRVHANTRRILDATTDVLANEGWGALSLVGVGREAGLSERSVRDRGATRGDLAAALWRERLGADVGGMLSRCIDGLRIVRATGDAAPLVSAWSDLVVRTPERDAAVELLIVSHYNEPVGAAVDDTLREVLLRWASPTSTLPPEDAAQHAFVLALAFGLLLTNHYPRARDPGLTEGLRTRAQVLQHVHAAITLPEAAAAHMEQRQVLAVDDPALDRLLNSTLDMIARRGFDQVTVAEIAADAGYTEGLAFRRYPTKLDLLADATGRQTAAGWEANEQFASGLASDHGSGVAEAVFLREAQKPGRDVARQMALEQLRLTRHVARVYQRAVTEMDDFRRDLLRKPGWAQYETEADFHLNIAAPFGAYLLPRFVPECYRLPYDVVTVPLFEAFERRRSS